MEMWMELENGDLLLFDLSGITIEQLKWIAENYKVKNVAYHHYQ